jgi:isopentenyl-diphosphate delta-isomerase
MMMQKTPPSARLNLNQFETRKRSHLEIALRPEVQASALSGFDAIRLEHDALPEFDLADVRLDSPFLKGSARRELATPFFVSGMTAGHASAGLLNQRLAAACAARGWIFGVGSQRRELDSNRPLIDAWSGLKGTSPGLVVLGNLGMAQAITASTAEVQALARNAEADAFCIHLNALQETIQPEGTPAFRGGVAALKRLATKLGRPLILKETGCGFSRRTLSKIRLLKLAAVDVSGLGGTHWGRIEGARAGREGDAVRVRAAETFADWGVSTVDSVRTAAEVLPKTVEIWASGGVRTGLDAAKLIALGATRVGFAKPALEAALAGETELARWMETVEFELRTALFCTGNKTPAALRATAFPKARKK